VSALERSWPDEVRRERALDFLLASGKAILEDARPPAGVTICAGCSNGRLVPGCPDHDPQGRRKS
jgi:hypothetical protein